MKAVCTECGRRWKEWDPSNNGHVRITALGGDGGAGKICGPVAKEGDPGYARALAKLS